MRILTLTLIAVLGAAVLVGAQLEEPTTPEEWLARCDANENGRVTCAEARAASCGAPIPITREYPLYQLMRDGDG